MRCKIFDCTTTDNRIEKEINEWLALNPNITLVTVVQSPSIYGSDEVGIYSHDKITIFYNEPK